MIDSLLTRIRLRQAELQTAFAAGIPSWEGYLRLVGEYDGLQRVLSMVDAMLEEEKNKE